MWKSLKVGAALSEFCFSFSRVQQGTSGVGSPKGPSLPVKSGTSSRELIQSYFNAQPLLPRNPAPRIRTASCLT